MKLIDHRKGLVNSQIGELEKVKHNIVSSIEHTNLLRSEETRDVIDVQEVSVNDGSKVYKQ